MRLSFALLLAVLVSPAVAQPEAPLPFEGVPAEVPALSEYARVSLLTMLPGQEVYSLFGHTALRVRDPALDLDRTYNYGTFDFSQPFFLLRFLRGHLDYRLAIAPFERTLAEYHYFRRGMLEQHLDLDAAERQALFLYLETNHLPAHRDYRYDFLFDNCSTRPRDAVEWALGERLSFRGYQPEGASFRDLVEPYVVGAPLTRFGIALGLGSPVDREATAREAQFLPLELFRAFEAATVDGRPLVMATDTLLWYGTPVLPRRAFDWPAALAWLALAAGLALTLLRQPARLRVFDTVLLAAVGFAGLVLLILWGATAHHVTHRNVDLLWAWPTHLLAALFVARGNDGVGMRVYLGAAALAGLLAALASLALSPLHAAVLPLGLLLALRCAARAWRPAAAPSPALPG
jgi:hypothetical protein